MQRFSSLPNAKAHGFTLLEVMVALTITALALGALFSVIGGNKRLAWRAEDVLVQSMQVRSMINVAQLNDEQGEVFLGEQQREFKLVSGEEIEAPDRKTAGTLDNLRDFHIEDDNGETLVHGSYWIRQQQITLEGAGSSSQDVSNPLGLPQ
jgi:prepilin-type N-terminal cleavage/methylation domain-containing protein